MLLDTSVPDMSPILIRSRGRTPGGCCVLLPEREGDLPAADTPTQQIFYRSRVYDPRLAGSRKGGTF